MVPQTAAQRIWTDLLGRVLACASLGRRFAQLECPSFADRPLWATLLMST